MQLQPIIRSIGSLLLLIFSVGIFAQNQTTRYEKDNIIIEVQAETQSQTEVDGFRNFELKIMNLTERNRSVHGKFQLYTKAGQNAGSCTLFVELKPGESITRTKACKEAALSKNFKFEIVKVYPFILDKETE